MPPREATRETRNRVDEDAEEAARNGPAMAPMAGWKAEFRAMAVRKTRKHQGVDEDGARANVGFPWQIRTVRLQSRYGDGGSLTNSGMQ